MPEFTGERLVPELVEADLLNEHMARYVLARSLAAGAEVLDAGCGVGYGTAELARAAASVVGLDCAADAIAEARRRYGALQFLEGACEQMPFDAGRFDLVVAFEVIEHLDDWRAFLRECVRVLRPKGRLLVSTPNKTYYAESRREAGPNPFHRHEFDYAEFQTELRACFGHVTLLLQNHAEGVLIAPPGPLANGRLAGPEAHPQGDPEHAHFFIALCSQAEVASPAALFYVPGAANVLRERERHIDLLSSELTLKNQAIAERNAEHQHLVDRFRALQVELEERNQWAADRQRESAERGDRIVALQQELEERNRWAADRHRESLERGARIVTLQQELEERNQWAADRQRESEQRGQRVVTLQQELADHQQQAQAALDQLHAELRQSVAWAQERDRAFEELARQSDEQARALRLQLEAAVADLARAVTLLDQAEAMVVERTAWAQREQQRAETLDRMVALASSSRWMRLGRKLGLGPKL